MSWFQDGGFLLVVLAAMVVEAAALTWLFRRTGRGLAPRSLLPGLGAGALMVAACGTALRGGGWLPTGGLLLAAGGLHALDLRGRWSSAPVCRHGTQNPDRLPRS